MALQKRLYTAGDPADGIAHHPAQAEASQATQAPARTPGLVPRLKKHRGLPAQPSAIHMGQIPLTKATLEAEDASGRHSNFVVNTDQADADPVNEYEEEEGEGLNHQAGIRSSPLEGNASGTVQHRGYVAVSNQHPAQVARYQTCKLLALFCHTVQRLNRHEGTLAVHIAVITMHCVMHSFYASSTWLYRLRV